MRRFIIAAACLCMPFIADAQVVDVITTRNGDTYEGFIAKQIPGKELTVQSVKTTVTVAQRDAEITRSTMEMLATLPEEYTDALPGFRQEDYVECATVAVTDTDGREVIYHDCVILGKGEELRFVSFENRTYDLKWSDVKVSAKAPYDFSASSGIYDVLMLPSAETIEGQLVEQNLKTGVMSFKSRNGEVTTYRKSGVQALRIEPVDKDRSLWEQVPVCDRINRKGGSSVEGLIISKVFGKSVTVQNYNTDIIVDIPVSDIESYEKYVNPLYVAPVYVPEDELHPALYVNGEHINMEKLVKDADRYMVLASPDSVGLVLNAGSSVLIQIRAAARTGNLKVAKTGEVKEKNFSITGLKIKKKGIDLWPKFDRSDILNDLDINFQSNDGEYIICDFVIPEAGTYVVFIDGSEECAVFKAK